jgi:hypothetical protein
VDLAAVAKQSGKTTSGVRVDLSVHEPSRHLERLRIAAAENRQSLTALDQNRFARLYSNPFASSKGASDLGSCLNEANEIVLMIFAPTDLPRWNRHPKSKF